MTTFFLCLSFTVHYSVSTHKLVFSRNFYPYELFWAVFISSFSILSEKFSTWIWRLPFALYGAGSNGNKEIRIWFSPTVCQNSNYSCPSNLNKKLEKLLSYFANKPFDYLMIAWMQISPSIPSFNVKLAISWIFRLSTLGLLNCFLFIYLFIYLFVRAGISSFVTSLNWQWDIGNVDKGFLISHVVEFD